MIKDEIKNLDDIETKIVMEESWVVMKRLWSNSDELKMHQSEIKINAGTENLKDEENKIRNVKDYFKKSITEVWDLYTEKKKDIDCIKKLGYKCEEFISLKRLKTRK